MRSADCGVRRKSGERDAAVIKFESLILEWMGLFWCAEHVRQLGGAKQRKVEDL